MQTARKLSITLAPSAVTFIETYRKRHKTASRSQVISEALRALEQRERERGLEAAYAASAQEDIAVNAEFDAMALDGLDSNAAW